MGSLTEALASDLPEGPDTDVFVVRAASARERLFHSSRFCFLATTVETAGRYSFLTVDIPVGGGPRPHVHQEADEWFYVLQGIPSSTPMTARSRSQGRLRARSHGHQPLVRGIRCADQGARRILSSRRGARFLVGPAGRWTSSPTPKRTAASEVRDNRLGGSRRRDRVGMAGGCSTGAPV